MKPVIISELPIVLPPFNAIIFPASATIPPVSMAVLLALLLVVKPNNPAIVGIMKAPENIVNAIRSD